jgi:small-conductance mechanosensitive channel
MNDLSNLFEQLIGISPETQQKLLASLIAIILLLLLRWIVFKLIERYYHDVSLRFQSLRTSGYIIMGSGIFVVFWIWLEGFTSLATFLGLVSAGMAIALKDLLIDLAGWIFIIWRHPFNVGDRVQLGEFAGDVIDIRPFQFTLLEIGNWVDSDQSTGRVIHIPNGKIFNEAQASYTQGFPYIWNEIPVLVTFESDWKKAKTILQDIAVKQTGSLSEAAQKRIKQAASKYLIFYSKLTPIVYTSVRDSGVLLTVRYLTEPRRRRGSEQAIWEDILNAFAMQPDISFAYPTQRFYTHVFEGQHRLNGDQLPRDDEQHARTSS